MSHEFINKANLLKAIKSIFTQTYTTEISSPMSADTMKRFTSQDRLYFLYMRIYSIFKYNIYYIN